MKLELLWTVLLISMPEFQSRLKKKKILESSRCLGSTKNSQNKCPLLATIRGEPTPHPHSISNKYPENWKYLLFFRKTSKPWQFPTTPPFLWIFVGSGVHRMSNLYFGVKASWQVLLLLQKENYSLGETFFRAGSQRETTTIDWSWKAKPGHNTANWFSPRPWRLLQTATQALLT